MVGPPRGVFTAKKSIRNALTAGTQTRFLCVPGKSSLWLRSNRQRLRNLLFRDIRWRHKVGEFQSQVSRVGRVAEAGFEVYHSSANKFFDLSVEVLHAFGCPHAHGIQ